MYFYYCWGSGTLNQSNAVVVDSSYIDMTTDVHGKQKRVTSLFHPRKMQLNKPFSTSVEGAKPKKKKGYLAVLPDIFS